MRRHEYTSDLQLRHVLDTGTQVAVYKCYYPDGPRGMFGAVAIVKDYDDYMVVTFDKYLHCNNAQVMHGYEESWDFFFKIRQILQSKRAEEAEYAMENA